VDGVGVDGATECESVKEGQSCGSSRVEAPVFRSLTHEVQYNYLLGASTTSVAHVLHSLSNHNTSCIRSAHFSSLPRFTNG